MSRARQRAPEPVVIDIPTSRAAYARSLERFPIYEDGTPRPGFDQMPKSMRQAWIADTSPLAMRPQNPENPK